MSASVNKVILIGNLAAKPELKFLPSGQAVGEMRIATSEKFESKGEKQEKTEWHSIVMWGKTAENACQYLDKGRSVYVEGKLQTRSWDDKTTGEKRYKTEIVATSVVFLGGKSDGGERGASQRPASRDGAAADLPIPDDDLHF